MNGCFREYEKRARWCCYSRMRRASAKNVAAREYETECDEHRDLRARESSAANVAIRECEAEHDETWPSAMQRLRLRGHAVTSSIGREDVCR